MMPVVQDWPKHLRKNVSTAQQVLRKILPEEIKAMPTETGGWKFQAMTDYSAVLREVRLDAISTILQEVKLSGSRPRRAARENHERRDDRSLRRIEVGGHPRRVHRPRQR
jgi:hypothetical protein